MNAQYDTIGIDYSALRKPDPRIAAAIEAALGDASTVLNVGAGTGNYEPPTRDVTAIEPSPEMIAQRQPSAAPALQGTAEALPFADDSFDAAMAVLTVHHWQDQERGLAEMRRVARGPVVILTFDPAHRGQWPIAYWPQLATLDCEIMPPVPLYSSVLGPVEIAPLPVPHDCTDGFLFAYWRRPHAYLDPAVRKAISSFWRIDAVEEGAARLAADLADGTWSRRFGHLLAAPQYDAGYRLLISRGG